MTLRHRALLLLGLALAGVIGAGGFLWGRSAGGDEPTAPRDLVLTAVMGQGIWTDESVTAANSWRRDFRPARPVVQVGRPVRLRLESADVVHSFAAPDLGIAEVEVYPGRGVDVVFTPREEGVFEFWCTTVCGKGHFTMRGFLEVSADGVPRTAVPARPGQGYWTVADPGPGADPAALGEALYWRSGCVACHGEDGRGGVPNPGSMNALVPPLDDFPRKVFLFTPEDVAGFRELFLAGGDGMDVSEEPEIPLLETVRGQVEATRELIRNGRRSSALDPAGPHPPLDMPAWGRQLDDPEIDLILGYLLSLGEAERTATPPTHGETP
ncbi:MAG: c-type cytochrome [Acidobacteria bacterium]|nr:c-type cytochrome [Acidobacteriota bacterium]